MLVIGPLLACVLPVAVGGALGVSRLGERFSQPGRLAAILASGERFQRRALVACVLLIPVILLLFASGLSAPRYAACVATIAAALWGAHRLAGAAGVVAAAGCVGVSMLAQPTTARIGYSIAGVLCALGAGQLIGLILRGRTLPFLVLLVAVDCAVVFSGLTSSVVFPLSADAGDAKLALEQFPPIYSGIVLGGSFIGGGDLACAVLVGFALRERPGRRRFVFALLAYLLLQAGVIVLAHALAVAMPATIPALAALLVCRYHPGVSARRSRADPPGRSSERTGGTIRIARCGETRKSSA